jgi:hypothetical protein
MAPPPPFGHEPRGIPVGEVGGAPRRPQNLEDQRRGDARHRIYEIICQAVDIQDEPPQRPMRSGITSGRPRR